MKVDIKICGTEKDAKLLKKIIKQYAEKTKSVVEKDNCDCIDKLTPDYNPIRKQYFYNNDWENHDWNSDDYCPNCGAKLKENK